jgi:hypothetical protein
MRIRLAAAAAIGIVGASWVAGIAEQTLRHALGDELLGGGRGRGSDQASGSAREVGDVVVRAYDPWR